MTNATLWSYSLFVAMLFSALSAAAQGDSGEGTFTDLQHALSMPDQVEVLILKRKKLKEWPEELKRFPNLHTLDLTRNKITTLPADMHGYSKLTTLILTHNKIDSLPASMGHMTSLRELYLGNNEIYHISEEIGHMKDLEILELWSNNVYYLPNSIAELEHLKMVDLRGIQMGEDYQQAIKDILPEGTKVRMSLSCNCD